METDELNDKRISSEVVTSFSSSLIEEFDKACKQDAWYQARIQDPELLKKSYRALRVRDGRIWWEHMLWIPNNLALQTRIIRECHDSPIGGHLGRDKTIELVERYFIWEM